MHSIVFVHGLKGDCLKTWTDKSANEPWPKALLPLELGTARILTYSYDATVVNKEDVPSQNRISNHAHNLVTALASLRQGDDTNERPIIFVCHSLGGLVCQDALVSAKQRSEQHLQDIANFTRGVVFLGTPHHGSSLAKMGELVSRSVGVIKETNSDIVQVLTRDSEVLARIQDSFQALLMSRSKDEDSMIDITCFYEELPTKRYGLIVPKHSAILPGYIAIGIHKNHADMTKFSGPCGVGKTQIALAYAYWLQEISKDTSVFWVHASSAERFSEAYAGIAKECKIPGHEDPSFDVLPTVRDWLASEESGQWLMIIDNADDMQLFFPQSDEPSRPTSNSEDSLGQYIPECANGTVLVTTRNMQVGSRLTKGKRPIEVGKMDEHESTQLLRQGLQQGDEPLKDLLQLSSRLEFLPLALVQAAAFIQENSITVVEYLELLDGSENDLVDLLNEEFEAVGRDSDTPRAVAQTWMLSFQQIERQYPFAGELLSLMSLFDRQAIPLEFLEFYSEEKKRAESNIKMRLVKALGVLKAFCFIRAERGGNHNMHRLVQLVTRTWLARKGTIAEFSRWALLAVSDFYPYGTFEEIPACTAYLAHAYSVLGAQHNNSKEDRLVEASLLHRVGGFFLYQGRLAEAERLQREATSIRTELLGEEHEETLVILSDLASTLWRQDRLDEAEALETRIMETWKRARGEEYYQTLGAMSNLAVTISQQGRSDEAEDLERHVVEVRKRVLGEEHLDTLISMNNLAVTIHGQNRYEEAIELHRHILEIRMRILGEENPETLISMANLGLSLYYQGDLGEAEELQQRVMDTRKNVLGEDHPTTLLSMQILADTWKMMGELCDPDMPIRVQVLGDALDLYKDCVRLRRETLGPDHADTEESCTGLAECQELFDLAIKELNASSTEANSQVVLYGSNGWMPEI
ncbi:hypothetical protein FSARC_7689 [Fusarium sarcochroum]|uniref:DUF676 domain-containing protein n=1 Tax=Fusarium sarcochroum TaxID=1208366 RepID=A0A8H4TUS1_9HYPO|nr:hypothetical protein FSARC_7689 [Fusarium sarcochroum]